MSGDSDRPKRADPDPPIIEYRTPPVLHPHAQPRAVQLTRRVLLAILTALPLLVGIFLYVNGRAGDRAQRVTCGSHLRWIGQSIILYRQDHGVWPQHFEQVMIAAEIDSQCFVCPSSKLKKATGPTIEMIAAKLSNPEHCSYDYHPPPPDAGDVDAETVIATERPGSHHGQGMNVLFADGHVEWLAQPLAQRLLSELQAGVIRRDGERRNRRAHRPPTRAMEERDERGYIPRRGRTAARD